MSEERERILRMVREGKISAEEGDELLAALEEGAEEKAEAPQHEEPKERHPAPPPEQRALKKEIPPSRSVGVMVAAFALIFLSLAWLLGGASAMLFTRPWLFKTQAFRLSANCFLGGWTLYGTFSTILAILTLIAATGVLFFREWARKLLVVVLSIHAIFSFFGLMLVGRIFMGFRLSGLGLVGLTSSSTIIGWIILDIFLIWFFSRRQIRPQFS